MSVVYFAFISSLCVPYAVPRSSFFVFSFSALGLAASGPHPLSHFCLAQTTSLDFTWLHLGVAYFTFISSLFVFYALPTSSFFRVSFCCLRAIRQWAPPLIIFLLGSNCFCGLYLDSLECSLLCIHVFIVCFLCYPKVPLFLHCLLLHSGWPPVGPPISNFCMAQTISVDFT